MVSHRPLQPAPPAIRTGVGLAALAGPPVGAPYAGVSAPHSTRRPGKPNWSIPKTITAPWAPGRRAGPGDNSIPLLGVCAAAPHCCEGWLHLAPRLRARVGLRLGAGPLPLEIQCGTALLQHPSNHWTSWTKPLVLSAIFAVSSTLHWELCVKLQLPMKAVFVELPYMTFA